MISLGRMLWPVPWMVALVAAGQMVSQAAPKTQLSLLTSAEVVRPGETFTVGVVLAAPAGWHTYWRNAGDSGAATKVEWTLPEGWKAGEIEWPVPEKDVTADLTTYVYSGEAILLVPITVAAAASPGPAGLGAKVAWLECADVCLPGKGESRLSIQVGPEAKPSAAAARLAAARGRLPKQGTAGSARASWERPAEGDTRPLLLEINDERVEDFFPFAAENHELTGTTERLSSAGGGVRLRKMVRKLEGVWPTEVAGLFIARAGGKVEGISHRLAITGDGGAVLAAATPAAGTGAAQDGTGASGSPTGKERSIVQILLAAFLGGLILNIMPCVLPVIALKILGFVNQSQDSPARVRRLGLVYGVGVLCSFLVLAALVIVVQQAGQRASWGMQFQNAGFLVVMTALVTLVALNLFGVFEVNLAGRVMGAAGGLAAKEGPAGAFFNGVLATTLSTPCTAPFLAPALGWAFIQPAPMIVLVFLTVGAGLAFPYVLLSWQPSWLKFLPKPGRWMERFKIAMGFPMLATAVWLFSLTVPHFKNGAELWLGVFLVFVALAAWIWGEFAQRSRARPGLARAVSVAIIVLAYALILERELHWRSPVRAARGGTIPATEEGGIPWQPWSAAAVAKARAEGRPVFVDFTANWCVTCQANKRTSIEIASVRAKLKEIDAVPLLGDYTLQDDAITAELIRWGRAGVPLVVVYPADTNSPPFALPEVLTPSIVLDALERAAPKTKREPRAARIDRQPWNAAAIRSGRRSLVPLPHHGFHG